VPTCATRVTSKVKIGGQQRHAGRALGARHGNVAAGVVNLRANALFDCGAVGMTVGLL
jgi:hypothetical protein